MNVSKFLEATFKLPLNSIWHLTFDIFNLCVKTGIFETILQDTKERTFFGAPFFGPSRGNFLSAEFLARIRTVGPQTASMNFASTWLIWHQQMGGAMVRFLDGGAESATCGTSPPLLARDARRANGGGWSLRAAPPGGDGCVPGGRAGGGTQPGEDVVCAPSLKTATWVSVQLQELFMPFIFNKLLPACERQGAIYSFIFKCFHRNFYS